MLLALASSVVPPPPTMPPQSWVPSAGFARAAVRRGRAAIRLQQPKEEEEVEPLPFEDPGEDGPAILDNEPEPSFSVQSMPGISGPLGFFDPAGFSESATEGRLRFYREVELKHGRVSMLAALGFPIAEQFHPLFGGEIDVPSYVAFQESPLQTFWPAVLVAISAIEVFSVFSFNSPFGGGDPWTIRPDYESGDLGFDPLRLRPESPEEFKELQTKELNNGRLAMIAVSGMIVQELVTGEKLWMPFTAP